MPRLYLVFDKIKNMLFTGMCCHSTSNRRPNTKCEHLKNTLKPEQAEAATLSQKNFLGCSLGKVYFHVQLETGSRTSKSENDTWSWSPGQELALKKRRPVPAKQLLLKTATKANSHIDLYIHLPATLTIITKFIKHPTLITSS